MRRTVLVCKVGRELIAQREAREAEASARMLLRESQTEDLWSDRERAAEELGAEFGTDPSEWLV